MKRERKGVERQVVVVHHLQAILELSLGLESLVLILVVVIVEMATVVVETGAGGVL